LGAVITTYDYDLVVIGSGPAGQRAAIQAAKLGKHVLVVERRAVVGGVCVNTGTIPSKTMREAALHLSGFRERSIYGASYSVKKHITMTDLLYRAENVIKHELDVIRHQLQRNGVEMIEAEASFADPHTLRLAEVQRKKVRDVTASKVVIAVGTSTALDSTIPFDGQRIFTSDDILELKELPRTLAVVGAGVIGCEYATIFAALGVRVTLIDKRLRLLDFVDNEIIEALIYQMRQQRVTLRLGEKVSGLEVVNDAKNGERVSINLKSGKHIFAQKALYSIGRSGATERLGLDHATLTADAHGRLKVNEFFQTEVPNIYAVGDVIGFPSLASASMEQGRLAACHAFGVAAASVPGLVP
jgi:NAD(P) transhydrogenase